MPNPNPTVRRPAFALSLFAALAPFASVSAPATECSANSVCYCINSDFKPVIDAQVTKLRSMIKAQRDAGTAVGYLSIPCRRSAGVTSTSTARSARERAYFGLTGNADLDRLGAFYDERLKTDADLQRAAAQGRVTRVGFRNYYGLRASVSFSLGAYDEWNIAQKINTRRRADVAYGTGNQLPTWFDGRAVSSAEAEQPMSAGYAGACKPQ